MDQFLPLQLNLQLFFTVNIWCKLDLKKREQQQMKYNASWYKNREGRVQQSCFLRSLMLQLALFPDVTLRWPYIPNFWGQSPFWVTCPWLKLSPEMSLISTVNEKTAEIDAAAVIQAAHRIMQYLRPHCGLYWQSGAVHIFAYLLHGQKKRQCYLWGQKKK